MLQLDEYRLELDEAQQEIKNLEQSLNPEKVRGELKVLEKESQDPALWENPERAKTVQKKIKDKQRLLDRFEKLLATFEDLEVFLDLMEEEGSEEIKADFKAAHKAAFAALERLTLQTLFTGKHDADDAIVTLQAGAGGTEAQDWTEMLYRMYSRWLEGEGYELEILDYHAGDEAGIKNISFQVSGEYAYGMLQSEAGVHRLVRISPFDSSGRRHTSFSSVEVLPAIDDDIEVDIKWDEVRIDYYRASGAGGQHVNKTSSAVRMTHLPTGIVVACQNERSQIQNREVATRMLRAKLYQKAEEERQKQIDRLKGEQTDNAWGNQIRSYVFCPYTLVKDHRTGTEVGDVNAVMDGEIEPFVNAYLLQKAKKK